MTIDRARAISDACADKSRPPARPAEPERYRGPSFVDPHDTPMVRELTGLEALTAWVAAGGDPALLRRKP